jgi:class 3 adenylate cyclase
VYQPVRDQQKMLLITAAILTFFVGLLAILFAQHFMRPVSALMASAERVNAGQADVAVDLTAKDEFGRFARRFNEIVHKLSQQQQLIARKQSENDLLMFNLLPQAVVERVRQGEEQIVDYLQQVTVIAVDVLGLFRLAEHQGHARAASWFNELIADVDTIAESHDVERHQISGDHYLAICGLSTPHLDHTKRVVDFSQAMFEALQRLNAKHGTQLGLRAGVHSGPVTASIIGGKKFM